MADLRKVFATATHRREIGQGTLLFVDEIHRFNRAQQDSFLPYVEDGTVVLVGATTENPSFELNGALLSRCQVMVLRRLDEAALGELLARAESLTGRSLSLTEEARTVLLAMADGDGRYLLGMVEQILAAQDAGGCLPGGPGPLGVEGLRAVVASRVPLYDKSREEHYNLISALHKSMRGSDPDAALYWLARLARETGSLMPPTHILNAPTRLMKELGYGEGYEYDPDTADGFSGADYLPDGVERRPLYEPTANGHERHIRERLEYWKGLRARKRGKGQE